jgi:hypothetical protein
MAFYYKNSTDVYVSYASSASGANASNTNKLNVIDFSFNKSSSSINVGRNTLNPSQDRGVAPYVSVVTPVSFSITTYVNPVVDTNVTSPEEYLLFGLNGVTTISSQSPTGRTIDFGDGYNVGELLNLIIWFIQPGKSEGNYRLDGAVIDSATFDIDIDNIAKVTFNGRALSITEDNTAPTATDRTGVGSESYIKTKSATVDIWYNNYVENPTMILMGGRITINNNNIFYGRNKLGEITVPEGSYTGNREISGELQVYLKDGTDESVDFYNYIINNIESNNWESEAVRPGLIYVQLAGNEHPSCTISMEDAILDFPRIQFNNVFSMNIPFTVYEPSTGDDPYITYNI